MLSIIDSAARVARSAEPRRRAPHRAQRIGRRSVLSALGTAIVGGALLPMLPFDRSGRRTRQRGARR